MTRNHSCSANTRVVVGDSLPDDGSGKTYLEKTETGWDGKTAWFTGSSK